MGSFHYEGGGAEQGFCHDPSRLPPERVIHPTSFLLAGPVSVQRNESSSPTKYSWMLKLYFKLDEGSRTWRLDYYGLQKQAMQGSDRDSLFTTLRMPRDGSASNDDNLLKAWPPVPVGSGFACSQLELPLNGDSTLRLSNLRVIAFANDEQLPSAKLYRGEGLRDEDGLEVDWVHCPADTAGRAWLIYTGLGLLVAVLGLVGGTIWRKKHKKREPYIAAGTNES